MVRAKLEKLDIKQLRKYISEHNKVVRRYIGQEIKQARVEYNQELKVRRREMRAARTLSTKGKKKPELIDMIMSEPLLVKRLKSELRVPFENLEKKRETIRKIKKERAQKLVDELKDLDKKYSPSNLRKLFGGMDGGQERRKATKALTEWTEKWNKLKIGSDSRLDTIFNRIKKNMLEASAKHPSETIEDEPEKVKEEKKKTDKKIKIPKIIITEAEEPTGGAPAEPRSKLGPIPKSNVRIRVAPKRKSPESVKFDESLINIEKKGRKKEVVYDDEESNMYIELSIPNRKNLTIEFQYSQFNKDKPRAPRGTTRKMLCKLINYVIEKNMITENAMVSLVAGDIEGTTDQKHDLIKLKKMYESMGFEATAEFPDSAIYAMPIKKFFEWCKKTYTDEFFILAEKKRPKKIPKITITEAEEEPDVGGAAEPKSSLGPIPKSNVRIRVGPKQKEELSIEEQVRRALAESDEKMEKENNKRSKPKPKPPADEIERIADIKRAIEDARKKGKKLSGLEFQLKELERQFDISDIKATPKPKKQAKQTQKKQPEPEPETTDEEEEPEPYDRSKVKVIPGIGRKLKEDWLDYMEYRMGGEPYTQEDQKFELEQFQKAEVDFFKARERRTDPNNSASKQAKAAATQARIRDDIKEEINELGEGVERLYQKLTPQLYRAYQDKKPSSEAAIKKILEK